MTSKLNVPAALAATLLAGIAEPAFAQSGAMQASRSAASTGSGGFYIWADGTYQSIHLPKYGLGLQNRDGQALIGPLASHAPTSTGPGVSGAIGYVLPDGILPMSLGSNVRIEVGGSYIEADSKHSLSTNDFAWFGHQGVNGFPEASGFCGGGCTLTSTLNTEYRSRSFNVTGASDYKFGAMTVTPSFVVFGGKTSNDQHLSQSMVAFGNPLGAATVDSRLKWDDWGAKFGLAASVIDITNRITLETKGQIGFARRDVDMIANDACPAPVCAVPLSASIAQQGSTTPLLVNAEIGLGVKLTPQVTLRGFTGLNYDSRVPGISAPSYTGSAVAPTSTTPAAISYSSETSYYAGGGLTVTFAP